MTDPERTENLARAHTFDRLVDNVFNLVETLKSFVLVAKWLMFACVLLGTASVVEATIYGYSAHRAIERIETKLDNVDAKIDRIKKGCP